MSGCCGAAIPTAADIKATVVQCIADLGIVVGPDGDINNVIVGVPDPVTGLVTTEFVFEDGSPSVTMTFCPTCAVWAAAPAAGVDAAGNAYAAGDTILTLANGDELCLPNAVTDFAVDCASPAGTVTLTSAKKDGTTTSDRFGATLVCAELLGSIATTIDQNNAVGDQFYMGQLAFTLGCPGQIVLTTTNEAVPLEFTAAGLVGLGITYSIDGGASLLLPNTTQFGSNNSSGDDENFVSTRCRTLGAGPHTIDVWLEIRSMTATDFRLFLNQFQATAYGVNMACH